MGVKNSDTSSLPSIDGAWALGEEKFGIIADLMESRGVRRFLEFGSGASTLHFSLRLPSTSITSVESKREFLKITEGYLEELGKSEVDLVHAPLGWRRDDAFDAVLVDGPVEAETVRGREGALYACFDVLRPGAIIFLDDYHRDGSKKMVRNWLRSYGSALELLASPHEDLAILEKKSQSPARTMPGLAPVLDNYLSLAHLIARKGKRLLLTVAGR